MTSLDSEALPSFVRCSSSVNPKVLESCNNMFECPLLSNFSRLAVKEFQLARRWFSDQTTKSEHNHLNTEQEINMSVRKKKHLP